RFLYTILINTIYKINRYYLPYIYGVIFTLERIFVLIFQIVFNNEREEGFSFLT
ncbi:uncharacterized protein B0T23DRAFT_327428, partial [Neurospora hispaniola]